MPLLLQKYKTPVGIELTTPGLQDQCSSHWAMEAYTDLTGFFDSHALCIYTVYELIYDNPALIR